MNNAFGPTWKETPGRRDRIPHTGPAPDQTKTVSFESRANKMDTRIELKCTNCNWHQTRQGDLKRQKFVLNESNQAAEWHESVHSHRVIRTVSEIDPETLGDLAKEEQREAELAELDRKHTASKAARIQILELPLEQGGDLGDETRSRFTVIVDRAPVHLADSQAFQDAMKDFARDSGAETAFVTSETIEIAEL